MLTGLGRDLLQAIRAGVHDGGEPFHAVLSGCSGAGDAELGREGPWEFRYALQKGLSLGGTIWFDKGGEMGGDGEV